MVEEKSSASSSSSAQADLPVGKAGAAKDDKSEEKKQDKASGKESAAADEKSAAVPSAGGEENRPRAGEPKDQKSADAAADSGSARPANPSGDAQWYIVHTSSGHEKKVVAALQQRVKSFGMGGLIQEALVPTQEKIVISDGKKKTVRERLFPGYVMVKMILTNETWAVVRNTSGVTGFVGAGARPTALPRSEVDAVLQFTRMEAPKMEVSFKEGETVKIIDGPFADFLGKVEKLDEEKGKVRVLVSIFGRETPVELDFLQVSRL